MEREHSAPLHQTQYGAHVKRKNAGSKVNPAVKALMDKGYNYRTAYRMANLQHKEFDYEANTPKGEWV